MKGLIKIWVTLIQEGVKTIDECPESIRSAVEAELKRETQQ